MDTTLAYDVLLSHAINFVSFRPRSEKELSDFLGKKAKKEGLVDYSIITRVMDRMRELGYVDDRAFVLWWVSQRSAFRPKGKRALVQEVEQKGVAHEVAVLGVSEALGESENGSEADMAKKAISKKIVKWSHLPIIEQKKKIYSYLSLRGFSGETIGKIIDEYCKKAYNYE